MEVVVHVKVDHFVHQEVDHPRRDRRLKRERLCLSACRTGRPQGRKKFSGVSGGPRPPHKSPLDTNAGEGEGGRGQCGAKSARAADVRSSFFVSVNLRVEGKSIS